MNSLLAKRVLLGSATPKHGTSDDVSYGIDQYANYDTGIRSTDLQVFRPLNQEAVFANP